MLSENGLEAHMGKVNAAPDPAASLDQLLNDRGTRYGKFTGHAACSQRIKSAIFSHVAEGGTRRKLTPSQTEALEMIAHKVARIMNGDPNYADSWRDIAGYATLVADELEGKGR
jgi:hypothetical protein